jgi:hypothetical protein
MAASPVAVTHFFTRKGMGTTNPSLTVKRPETRLVTVEGRIGEIDFI